MSEAIITPSAIAMAAPVDLQAHFGAWMLEQHGPGWAAQYIAWVHDKWDEYRATLDKEPGVSLTLEERAGFDEWLRERVK